MNPQFLEHHAVLLELRAHPEWTMDQIVSQIIDGGPRARALAELTVAELLEDPAIFALDEQGRFERARAATGDEFDRFVLAALTEAGRPVGAAELRRRVGGPLWKVQASLSRLVDRDLVTRSGRTCATRYRRVEGSTP